jgi:phosphomannomutase
MALPKIFKAYDIRGTVPDQLNEELAYDIGRAFVTFLKCRQVVVGRDVRATSDAMFAALARGINDLGADVLDIGQSDTPMLYFAAHDKPAAIMITASHNPPEYNGFKMCRENAIPISGDTGIKDMESIAASGAFDPPAAQKGAIRKLDIKKEFVAYQQKAATFGGDKKLKVVIDTANGAGSLTYPDIFKGLDCDMVPLFMEPDGAFPNHEANPLLEENLVDLKKKVVDVGADLGAAIDGDADRCMFVDAQGNTLRADVIGTIVALEILKHNPGATFLYDLRSTRAFPLDVEAGGGKAVQCRVGHAFIKNQMREHNAIFACELSGHFYFRDHYFTESSAMALIRIMNLMHETGKTLAELAAPAQRLAHSGEINFKVEDKDGVLKRLEEKFGAGGAVSHMDGLSVEFDNWWFNVRASNTEPFLRLNLEAPTPDETDKHKQEIVKIIEQG